MSLILFATLVGGVLSSGTGARDASSTGLSWSSSFTSSYTWSSSSSTGGIGIETCSEDQPCSSDELTCVEGYCVPTELGDECEPSDPRSCDNSNSTCIAGYCLPIEIPIDDCDLGCLSDEQCVAGFCVPLVEGEQCNSTLPCADEMECVFGYCLDIPIDLSSTGIIPGSCDEGCGEGEQCIEGFCVPTIEGDDCSELEPCPGTNETCVFGWCVPDIPTSECDCEEGETCIGGFCVPIDTAECNADTPCEGGAPCIGGTCFDIDCRLTFGICPGDFECVDDFCVPTEESCSVDTDCDNGYECDESGVCVEVVLPCDECTSEETCISNICVPNDVLNSNTTIPCEPACSASESCAAGICFPVADAPPCDSSNTCAASADVCVAGVCIPESASTTESSSTGANDDTLGVSTVAPSTLVFLVGAATVWQVAH